MARPIKKSLDYFSLDVGIFNDRKIKRLLKNFGGRGFSIYIYLLTEIYGDKGYYLIWDNYYPRDIADALGDVFSANLISEVLVYCVKTGLFDRELFNSSVITSRSIQERYVEAKGKGKEVDDDTIASFIFPEYNLLSANKTIKSDLTELNDIKPSLTELNDIKSDLTELNGVSTLKESKVKETKKEESKEKNIFPIDSFLPEAKKESEPLKRFIKPSISEIDAYAKSYLQEKGYLVSFNAESFFDFYESKGWFVGKNKMKDWKASVRNWINGDNKNQSYTSKSSKKADFESYDFSKNPLDF